MTLRPKPIGLRAMTPEPRPVGLLPIQEGPDIATMSDTEFPENLRSQSDKMRNAYYYSRNLGLSAEDAYNHEGAINERLYGVGTTSQAAWAENRRWTVGARRKGILEAAKHGFANLELTATKMLAGLGRAVAETKGVEASALIDPALHWMLSVPKDMDLDKTLAGIADAASNDIKQAWKDYPERAMALDPDAGYAESLWQVLTRPENLVQALIESAPVMLEGMLGTITAGPVGGVAAMSLPRFGEVYQDARRQGTGITPAFAQALLTSVIESGIEEWTLGRKIGLGQNVRRILEETGPRRLLWEGTKAFFRGTGEETAQQINENFWRWVFTDRSQKWFDGVKQAAALGGPMEAAMSGAFATVGYISTPVNVRDAQRRLNGLRRIVRADTALTTDEKTEILGQIDAAAGLVPDIVLGKEGQGGEAKAKPPAGETAAGTVEVGGMAEPSPVAGGTEEVTTEAKVPGESEKLWQRLTAAEPFTPVNTDETAVKELYDEGLIQRPEDVAEALEPGSTATVTPEIAAPSARTTTARQVDLLQWAHDQGRDPVNSFERKNERQIIESDAAREAETNPDKYISIIRDQGQPLSREQTAGLVRHLANLKNQHESIARQINEATEEIDTCDLATQAGRIEAQEFRVVEALLRAGSEAGGRLQIQKMVLNEYGDPVYLKARAQAKQRGKPLSAEDAERFDKMAATIADQTNRIAELQAKVDAQIADQQVKRPDRRRKTETTADRETRLAANKDKLRKLLEAGC